MDALTRSPWYSMEYSFCQTDTFPELDRQVRDAGGVCSVCAIDWVLGKLEGQPFIFSAATVSEKSRQFKHQPTFHEVYADAIPTMQLGHTTMVDINATGGSAIASATAAKTTQMLKSGVATASLKDRSLMSCKLFARVADARRPSC